MKTSNHIKTLALLAFFFALSAAGLANASLTVSTTTNNSFVVTKLGSGKPVILIPGLMSDASVYKVLATELAQKHQVHLVSLKGFASTPLDQTKSDISNNKIPLFSLKNFTQELVSYIAKNNLKKPTIIGHSMGGLSGLYMASYHEESIGKVISIDGLPFIGPMFTRLNSTTADMLVPQANAAKTMFANMTSKQLAAQTRQGIYIQATAKESQEYIIDMAKRSNPRFVGEAMYEVMTTDLREKLSTSNSLILMLGASGGFTQAAQHQQVESLYQAQFEKVENAQVIMNTTARHFIMLDDPKWLLTKITAFLGE